MHIMIQHVMFISSPFCSQISNDIPLIFIWLGADLFNVPETKVQSLGCCFGLFLYNIYGPRYR